MVFKAQKQECKPLLDCCSTIQGQQIPEGNSLCGGNGGMRVQAETWEDSSFINVFIL